MANTSDAKNCLKCTEGYNIPLLSFPLQEIKAVLSAERLKHKPFCLFGRKQKNRKYFMEEK